MFLEEPRGPVIDLNEMRNTASKSKTTGKDSKTVFTQEPLSHQSGGSRWLEVKCDDVNTGFVSSMGLGFTVSDPSQMSALPRRASELENTVLVGYTGKVYWLGTAFDIDWNPSLEIKTMACDEFGVLISPKGILEVYLNRVRKATFSALDNGCEVVDISGDVWGVVDLWGGPSRVSLLRSNPPDEAEQEAARKKLLSKQSGKTTAAAAPAVETSDVAEAEAAAEDTAAE